MTRCMECAWTEHPSGTLQSLFAHRAATSHTVFQVRPDSPYLDIACLRGDEIIEVHDAR
jgi:hypothetical protein